MALTSRITLAGPPAEDPEDYFGASLGVIFPDDVMNQRECVFGCAMMGLSLAEWHGMAWHGIRYTVYRTHSTATAVVIIMTSLLVTNQPCPAQEHALCTLLAQQKQERHRDTPANPLQMATPNTGSCTRRRTSPSPCTSPWQTRTARTTDASSATTSGTPRCCWPSSSSPAPSAWTGRPRAASRAPWAPGCPPSASGAAPSSSSARGPPCPRCCPPSWGPPASS